MMLNMKSLAESLASRQGGIYLTPGRSYQRVLSRTQIIGIFGKIPEYSVHYGLCISVKTLDEDHYEVTVTRTRNW